MSAGRSREEFLMSSSTARGAVARGVAAAVAMVATIVTATRMLLLVMVVMVSTSLLVSVVSAMSAMMVLGAVIRTMIVVVVVIIVVMMMVMVRGYAIVVGGREKEGTVRDESSRGLRRSLRSGRHGSRRSRLRRDDGTGGSSCGGRVDHGGVGRSEVLNGYAICVECRRRSAGEQYLCLSQEPLHALHVGIGAQAGQVRLDSGRDHVPLLRRLRLRHLQGRLDHVVAEWVLQQANKWVFVRRLREKRAIGVCLELCELARHHLYGGGVSNLQTFFYHVRTELLRREEVEVAEQVRGERLAHRLQAQIEHVLHHVIAELILHQAERVVPDFANKLHLLLIRRVIDASLHHAASVAVRSDLHTMMCHCVVDELIVVGL